MLGTLCGNQVNEQVEDQWEAQTLMLNRFFFRSMRASDCDFFDCMNFLLEKVVLSLQDSIESSNHSWQLWKEPMSKATTLGPRGQWLRVFTN
jgi:hypothetical protein